MRTTPTLLIVTNKADPHADEVISILSTRGTIRPVRLNSNDFFSNCGYRFRWTAEGRADRSTLSISDSGCSVDTIDIGWWRKPAPLQASPDLTNPDAIEMAVREGNALLRCLDAPFEHLRWVNRPDAMYAASPKLQQFRVARAFGLSIPETLVTNDGAAILEFTQTHERCIVKPMSAGAFMYEGRSFGVFTSQINEDHVASLLDSVAYAPVLVQREIEKCAELRITCIGNNVFACEIQSQESEFNEARTDWRVVEPTLLPHRIVTIPAQLSDALLGMLKHYDLNYGAFDVIQESDGRYYFLELNPNGQYLWIERITGAPMSAAMVQLMEDFVGIRQ